jgi:hypothetical protein
LREFLWPFHLREKVKSGSISFQGVVGTRGCTFLQLVWRSAGISGSGLSILA